MTKAKRVESGDQELTLMVPCPPKKVVNTWIWADGASGSMRNWTPGSLSLCVLVPLGNERNSSHFPSGEGCGNQSSNSSLVICSAFWSLGPAPLAGMRQISQPPERLELK